jgi:hypothetical protein
MRYLIDFIIVLIVIGLLAGAVWHKRETTAVRLEREAARAEVRRFQQQISLQSALASVHRNDRGVVETIDPQWFGGDLPRHPLLSDSHPWLEIASPEQRNLIHPLQRVAVTSDVAKFWFNPHTGIVRARVPATLSDAQALELYNFINDTKLSDLFASE